MSPLVRLFLSYLRSVCSCPVLLSCWLLSCLLMSCLLSSPLVLSTLVLSRRSLGTFWRAVGASWKPLRSLWGDLLGPLAGLRGLILALLTALGRWALLAPPKRLLELPRRLQSRSLPKSQNSSTVQRFSRFFGPPGAHLAPPEALLGLSWRPLGPSWRLLGGLSGVGRLLGGSWQGPVGPGWFWGGSGRVPEWARRRRVSEPPETPYVFIV